MGVKVEDFLYDYFGVNQLKEALSDIGVPAGKNKKECVDRILEKWISYNRSWYDLLNFLDMDDLENICDHFLIEYGDWDSEDTLMDKIEANMVLDFRKTPKKKEPSKPEKNQSTLNIRGENITIGSNNKINSDNKIKIHSDNLSIYDKLSKNQRVALIIGIIGILATIGFGTYQMYESVMENWQGANAPESEITDQELGELLQSGNVEEYNKIKRDRIGKINFDGLRLSDMDLTLVDLRYASLVGATFDNSNLTTAFFEGANLEKASFSNANLERAGLVEANLKNAFLRGADLEMANLNRADLQNADLSNANLRQASLIKTNLQNTDLKNAEFLWANLENANLEGAVLNGTDFREVQNLPISSDEAKTLGAEVN